MTINPELRKKVDAVLDTFIKDFYETVPYAQHQKSASELMGSGTSILKRDDVMDGVAEMLEEVQVEGTFPDGTKLVTIHHPIR